MFERSEFNYWLGDCLPSIQFFVNFLRLYRKLPGLCLKINHSRFPPHYTPKYQRSWESFIQWTNKNWILTCHVRHEYTDCVHLRQITTTGQLICWPWCSCLACPVGTTNYTTLFPTPFDTSTPMVWCEIVSEWLIIRLFSDDILLGGSQVIKNVKWDGKMIMNSGIRLIA